MRETSMAAEPRIRLSSISSNKSAPNETSTLLCALFCDGRQRKRTVNHISVVVGLLLYNIREWLVRRPSAACGPL